MKAPGFDLKKYTALFQKAADKLDKKKQAAKKVEVAVGIYSDSVFLKLYKTAWANKCNDPVHSPSRIFFSVWATGKSIKQGTLFYNIHALKLRKLEGYNIESRKFAEAFRKAFRPYESEWPDVSTAFGPLTLMEGCAKITPGDFEKEIISLSTRFLKIEHLIDEVLSQFKK